MTSNNPDTGAPVAQPPSNGEVIGYPYELIRESAESSFINKTGPEVYMIVLDLVAFKFIILHLCKEQKKLLTGQQNSHLASGMRRWIDWGYERQAQKQGDNMEDYMAKAIRDHCKHAVKLFEELP